jgi:cytochrome c oxidase subunit III
MKVHPVVDVSGMSVYNNWTRAPLWWGFMGMIAIEATVFSTFIVSYFYLKSGNAVWPPMPHEAPELLLPTINTLILIASSFVVHWGDRGIKAGDQRRLQLAMMIAGLMAVVFLVLKIVEYSDKTYRWDSGAYGSIVWTIIGFHSAHVLAVLLKTIVVDILAWRGYFNAHRRLGAEVNGIYWHFVVIVWLPLYFTIYITPRL